MNRFKILLVALAAWASTCAAQAAVVEWRLVDVVFADGGTATGTFTFETTTRSFIAWDITTTAGTAPGDPFGAGFEFTPTDSWAGQNIDTLLRLLNPLPPAAPKRALGLAVDGTSGGNFSTPVAVLPLWPGIAFEQNNAIVRYVSAGYVTAVPEPGTAALWAAGLALAAGIARRRAVG